MTRGEEKKTKKKTKRGGKRNKKAKEKPEIRKLDNGERVGKGVIYVCWGVFLVGMMGWWDGDFKKGYLKLVGLGIPEKGGRGGGREIRA